ncbi:MAG TPA: hypothetical protein VIV60_36235 [Polyangiaceae bacterium]
MNTRSLAWMTIPAAMLSISCGDAVPPPGEAAVSVQIGNSRDAPGGYACGQSHTLIWGNTGPSSSSQGSTWIDGEDGKEVSCSVSGGGTYEFSGKVVGQSSSFSITGSVQAGGTGTASVYFFDTGGEFGYVVRDNSCTVSATDNYKVEKGAVWASFHCSHMTSAEDMYLWCDANGTFVFKSCDD